MSETLKGVLLFIGTIVFIVSLLVILHTLEQRRRHRAEAARRTAEAERARRKANGTSDIDPIESLIGIGLMVAAGVVVYKVAKSVLGGDKPGATKLPAAGKVTPSLTEGRGSYGGGSYSGGGGGYSGSGGGGSSESVGSGSGGGGGGSYADVESSSDDDRSDSDTFDDSGTHTANERGSDDEKSNPFGDFDFRLFEEGCPDCLSPATNISIGDGKCKDCAGTGHEAWTGQDCPTCDGSGDCQTCDGTGKC